MVNKWSYLAQNTVGKQFVRAADSISANIAEGYGRKWFKENRTFCYYSRGSLQETITWAIKAKNRDLLTPEEFQNINNLLTDCKKKLNGYIKYINTCIQNESKK